MKFFKISSILLMAVLLFASCSNKEKDAPSDKNEFIRYTQALIESYGSSPEDIDKEIIEYVYEEPNDFFWKTALHKSENGQILKTIKREFDESRFPIKEFTEEGEIISEIVVLKYDPKFYEITEKVFYNEQIAPENKVREERYYYDNEGYIESQDVTIFENNGDFKNIEGNNVKIAYTLRPFPLKHSRPKGNIMPAFFVEKYQSYFTEDDKSYDKEAAKKLKVGDIYVVEETKFNEEGMPTYFRSTKPECEDHPGEEWFSSELDGIGNVAIITSFTNEKLDLLDKGCTRKKYEYNDQGIVVKMEEKKYNVETKEFDIPHDLTILNWMDPQVESFANFLDVSKRIEHSCSHSNLFNVIEKKIEKFADGEKIVLESRVNYPNDSIPDKIELKLRKKTTYKYEKINK